MDLPDTVQDCFPHHRDFGFLVFKISLTVQCQNMSVFLKSALSATYLRYVIELFYFLYLHTFKVVII